ncbi:GntR family transcriptional regulator [Pectinatus frisingensis]|uniref:GntR family transcriptional regulator n=1 Tax=Pectinatus frisingensis TaxID=865 RepID=UPI0018C83200|nr:GntR family transcriptional regulator [Pectinatus frisingensis]
MKSIPKYVELMKWLESAIINGDLAAGERLPSENELGDRFSISRQTVRQATSILESRGLLERRRGSGTYVKYSAENQIALPHLVKTIGVVTTYLNEYIFPAIIKGIDDILVANNYFVQLSLTYNKMEREADVLSKLLAQKAEGLIIEPAKTGLPNTNKKIYRQITQASIPCVFINASYPDMDIPCVAMDDYACGQAAIEHLIKCGHKKIGGLFKLDDMQGRLRYAGCVDALHKHQMNFVENSLIWYTTEDRNEEFMRYFGDRILKINNCCTAMVCYNDQISREIVRVLYSNGKKVPEDISLVSFDDSNFEFQMEFGFGLTTFRHPKEELGRVAASMLLKLIKGEPVKNIKFPPELIGRTSVKRII